MQDSLELKVCPALVFESVGFECSYLFLCLGNGGVAKPAVDISLFRTSKDICCLLCRLEGIGAGGIDRCQVGAVLFALVPAMHTDRIYTRNLIVNHSESC